MAGLLLRHGKALRFSERDEMSATKKSDGQELTASAFALCRRRIKLAHVPFADLPSLGTVRRQKITFGMQ